MGFEFIFLFGGFLLSSMWIIGLESHDDSKNGKSGYPMRDNGHSFSKALWDNTKAVIMLAFFPKPRKIKAHA